MELCALSGWEEDSAALFPRTEAVRGQEEGWERSQSESREGACGMEVATWCFSLENTLFVRSQHEDVSDGTITQGHVTSQTRRGHRPWLLEKALTGPVSSQGISQSESGWTQHRVKGSGDIKGHQTLTRDTGPWGGEDVAQMDVSAHLSIFCSPLYLCSGSCRNCWLSVEYRVVLDMLFLEWYFCCVAVKIQLTWKTP